MIWRRKWQPTPAFLPGDSHGQKSLAGYSPRGRKELDRTEQLHFHFQRPKKELQRIKGFDQEEEKLHLFAMEIFPIHLAVCCDSGVQM